MKTITVGALSAAIGLASGLVGATVKTTAWAEGIASAAALEVVSPVQQELHHHLGTVSAAMQPGGAMYEFQQRQALRDAYLVDAVSALCRATPNASCPSPAALVRGSR